MLQKLLEYKVYCFNCKIHVSTAFSFNMTVAQETKKYRKLMQHSTVFKKYMTFRNFPMKVKVTI